MGLILTKTVRKIIAKLVWIQKIQNIYLYYQKIQNI